MRKTIAKKKYYKIAKISMEKSKFIPLKLGGD